MTTLREIPRSPSMRVHSSTRLVWTATVALATVVLATVVPTTPGISVAAPPRSVAHPRAGLTLDPAKPIADERVTVTARVPGGRRPVVLQRRAGSNWVVVTTGQSSKDGAVALTARLGRDSSLRVVAPRSGGADAFTGPAVAVDVVAQSATLKLESALCTGREYDAALTVKPARKGRSAQLQVSADRGKTWKAIGEPARQSAVGKVTLTFAAPNSAREYRFRAVVEARSGAASVVSATLTRTAAPCAIVTETLPFVAAGGDQTCEIDLDGVTWCWGENDDGALGTGNTDSSSVPVRVAGDLRFARLALGVRHSCGLLADGTAYCWGDNGENNSAPGTGAVGDGTAINRLVPTKVAGRHKFTSIALGQNVTCGVATTGLTYCWGDNERGSIGDGAPLDTHDHDRLVPTLVSGGWAFQSVHAHESRVCGLTKTGVAYCWGPSSGGDHNTPTRVPGDIRFRSIEVGNATVCGISTSGSTYCWDTEYYGSFGDGTSGPSYSASPILVSGSTSFSTIDLGNHVCALDTESAAWCWGDNGVGSIGIGTSGGQQDTPAAVSGELTFTQLSVGYSHTCGVADFVVWCWGFNGQGQLGIGTSGFLEGRTVPTPVGVV